MQAKPIGNAIGLEPMTVVWAGFGGERRQDQDLSLPATDHRFAGDAIGFDRVVAPGLQLGGFAGGAWAGPTTTAMASRPRGSARLRRLRLVAQLPRFRGVGRQLAQ